MKKPLTNQDLQAIKSGDLLCVSGTSWLADIIQDITESKWNHTGIIIWENNELRVYEADFKGNRNGAGVVNTDFSDYLNKDSKLLIRHPLFEFSVDNLIEFCLDNVGRINYSYWDLIIANPIKSLCKWLFNKKIWLGTQEGNKRQLVCSAWSGLVYNSVRPDIEFFQEYKALTPANEAKNNKLFDDVLIIYKKIVDFK
jgi:hypothetical protein